MESDGRTTCPPLGDHRRLIGAHSRHIAPDHFDARENLFDLVSASIEVTSIALVETSNTDAAPRGGHGEKCAFRRLRRRPRQVPLLRDQSNGTSTMSFAGLPNDDARGKVAETGGRVRASRCMVAALMASVFSAANRDIRCGVSLPAHKTGEKTSESASSIL